MPAGIHTERRGQNARGYDLCRSVLLRIPQSVVVTLLWLSTLATAILDRLLSHEVWFGPVYLIVCACASWLVSCRFAIRLGLMVILFNSLTDTNHTLTYGPNFATLDLCLKIISLLTVVLMLGLARKALDRQWLLARTDPLTGALNRQAFFETIRTDSDQGGPALLIFADLDGLKRLNDELGHEMGDTGLRNFADRIRRTIRKKDLFARIGGDEFVLLLKIKDESAINTVANRLNKALNLDSREDEVTLKCSIGILFLPTGSQSIDDELNLADQLMYAAKRAQAGVAMATAAKIGQEITLFPNLVVAPRSHESIMRSNNRQSEHEAAHSGGSHTGALAA